MLAVIVCLSYANSIANIRWLQSDYKEQKVELFCSYIFDKLFHVAVRHQLDMNEVPNRRKSSIDKLNL